VSLSAVAGAQNVALTASVSAGGAGTSTGGVVTVSATIGQLAAGTMSADNVVIRGGFWREAVAVQSIGAPMLTIKNHLDGSATISWSPNTSGFLLQETSVLDGSAISWSSAPAAYTNGAVIPASEAMRFYRLVNP
jgi:hypothetical protein